MRDRLKSWILGVAGACTIATCGALSAQVQDPTSQGNRDARERQAVGAIASPGQDVQMLIAHGLAMAIEGSTLESLAIQRGGGMSAAATPGAGAATGTGASGPAINEGTGAAGTGPGTAIYSGGSRFAGTPRTGEAGTGTAGTPAGSAGSGLNTYGGARNPRTGEAGTGTAGSPVGSAGSGLNTYGRDPDVSGTPPAGTAAGARAAAGITTAGAGAGPSGAGRAGTTGATRADIPTSSVGAGATGPAGARSMTTGGQSADQIEQHARRAFDASERLLRQAAGAGGATGQFYQAANRYATTLRTLGATTVGQGGARGEMIAMTGVVPGSLRGLDPSAITVINHGVKEALDALQLKQMIRAMGSDTAAGRALMDHARQMDTESQQAIDSLALVEGTPRPDATGPGAGTGVPATTGGGTVQLLVQQSREVLQAIRALDANPGEGGGRLR